MPQTNQNALDLKVIKQVTSLHGKTASELTELWNKMFEHPPAVASRQHMIAKLAYRIQELTWSGTDEETERKIQACAKEISRPKKIMTRKFCPMIGTKIVKEYKGAIHEILVVNDGFAYAGAVYSSLSAIATKITGTKWNGIKFFNLNNNRA
jgi:hypothetical protein